jgi:hypothetical protein
VPAAADELHHLALPCWLLHSATQAMLQSSKTVYQRHGVESSVGSVDTSTSVQWSGRSTLLSSTVSAKEAAQLSKIL